MTKKILLVDPSSYSLPYDINYLSAIAEENYKVDFFFSELPVIPQALTDFSHHNVRLFCKKISPQSTPIRSGVIEYLKLLLNIYVHRKDYDFIHFQWSIFFPLELPFFLILRKKLIFTLHNDVPHNHRKRIYIPYLVLSKICKKLIFVSQYTKTKFESNYGKSPKFQLLNHGIMRVGNCEQHTSQEYSGKNDLIFWGRVEDYKGIDIFLTNFMSTSVSIIGAWNPELTALRKELGFRSNIHIRDDYISEKELCAVLNEKAVFILPYKTATQSGVLYTLLAHAKVFISSRQGENYEFLKKHNLSELSFDRDDSESVAAAYNFAITNYAQIRERLKAISHEYNWQTILTKERLESIYGV